MSDYKGPFTWDWTMDEHRVVVDHDGNAVPLKTVLEMLNAHARQSAQRCEAKITTRCPSCGHATIMVTDSGDLVCSLIGCQDPTAINRQSAQRCETCRYNDPKQTRSMGMTFDTPWCHRWNMWRPFEVNGCTAHQPKEQA